MSWAEAAYGSAAGVTGGFYSPQPPAQTPPGSPESTASIANGHYTSSVVYITDSQSHKQNGRRFLTHDTRVNYDQQVKDQDQAGTGSDTPSDSEAHTPDSWSSGCSREGNVSYVDVELPHWPKKELEYKLDGGSPGSSEVVSSSLSVVVEESSLNNRGEGESVTSPEQLPKQPRKAKARTAFSEGQMNALTDRFNVQRYLTPAEMETLAGLTGLTYKQVKTWFQNRRMKLKRHQKDNSWVSERYIGAGVNNTQIPHFQFQVGAPKQSQDLFTSPQYRNAFFKKNPPQRQAFYSSYTLPLSPSQMSNRPQGNWPLPPAVMHYEFPNTSNCVPVSGNNVSAVDPDSKPTQLATVHSASQWSS
ncbi:homeobox protein NANOG isoform X2 [Hoplias malabaricus]